MREKLDSFVYGYDTADPIMIVIAYNRIFEQSFGPRRSAVN